MQGGFIMHTHGNLALNPAYKPEYRPTQAGLRKKAEITQHEAAKSKAKNLNVAVAIFYIVLIFSVAFCLVSREVSLYEKSRQINALENRLEQAQSETKQARVAAERAIDLKTIEESALSQFAMSRPEKSQTVYINIQQDDYTGKVAQKDMGIEIQQSIQSSIKNLFGIFGIN